MTLYKCECGKQEKEINQATIGLRDGKWVCIQAQCECDSVQLAEWGLDVWQNEDDEQNNDVNDISDNINEEYRVEIELTSEREQEQVFNELTKKGYKCRILTF